MKQLLFTIHYLELGGAERSLIGLLEALDYSRVDVDLFVYNHRGELMKMIPPQVHILPEIPEYAQIERPLKEVLRNGYWRIVLARLKAKWQIARYAKRNHPKDGSAIFSFIMKNVVPLLPPISPKTEYDLAVSFLTPHNFVLKKVRARKKVAWIHTDYSQIDVDRAMEFPVWAAYDKIVSISPDVTRAFLEMFPSLEHKIVEIPNVLSPKLVRERAENISSEEIEKEMPREQGVVNLLSVGRFSAAKNYDNVPDICRRILNEGLSVRWFIIGYGGDESLIRRKIQEAGMEDHVILLGKKENPYPYMKACDIYVQPSRYEGNAVTVREAQILGKPVIVTDYPTAHSQIRDGQDGIIVPMDNEGCARGITALVSNWKKQSNLAAFCLANDFGNEAEVEKLLSLL
jgi:glycosyltransferase involved in cell wall biosynthesis